MVSVQGRTVVTPDFSAPPVTEPPTELDYGLVRCRWDRPMIRADIDSYRDTPIDVGDSQPEEEVWAWAEAKPYFVDVRIVSFGVAFGSGCSLRLDGIVVDHERHLLHGDIVIPGSGPEGVCLADLNVLPGVLSAGGVVDVFTVVDSIGPIVDTYFGAGPTMLLPLDCAYDIRIPGCG